MVFLRQGVKREDCLWIYY